MEQVKIKLECEKKDIADLKIQNLNAGVIMKTSYTEVTVNLQDIIVTDMNAASIHPTVISFSLKSFNMKFFILMFVFYVCYLLRFSL